MVAITALRAEKHRLRSAAFRIDVPAHRALLRVCNSAGRVGESVCRLRVRAKRSELRAGSCASSRVIPTESCAFDAGEFAKGCFVSEAPRGSTSGSVGQTLGGPFLVSVLLRDQLRRRSARRNCAIYSTTAGLLPALKDGVSAPEIR